MQVITRGVVAGPIGGAARRAGMAGGRRAGAREKTLAGRADERFRTREPRGGAGTAGLERTAQRVFAPSFGRLYAELRPCVSRRPWAIAGLAHRACLNANKLAPMPGSTRGAGRARPHVVAQRLDAQLLFGATVAPLHERLTPKHANIGRRLARFH